MGDLDGAAFGGLAANGLVAGANYRPPAVEWGMPDAGGAKNGKLAALNCVLIIRLFQRQLYHRTRNGNGNGINFFERTRAGGVE
ncbi:MAG: hypothetical protein HZA03_06880 [Nitrospinae bacterium]|nr:hypothetical protein [Nitrospinota bacterium]